MWVLQNAATVLISLGLVIIVTAIIINMQKNRKKGKTLSLYWGKCANCPMGKLCHKP